MTEYLTEQDRAGILAGSTLFGWVPSDAALESLEAMQAEVEKIVLRHREAAWDEGYSAARRDEKREREHANAFIQTGCDCLVPTTNPYEGE